MCCGWRLTPAQGHDDLDSADVFPRLRHAPRPLATHHTQVLPVPYVSPRGIMAALGLIMGLYAHCFQDVCHAKDNRSHRPMHIGKLRINSRGIVLFL